VPVVTPVIPATQEAEIRRTEFEASPGQTVQETQSQKKKKKKKPITKKGWWSGLRYRP
jgi:hypothetical protein